MKRQASGINGGLDLAAAAAVVILLLACCAGGGISRGSDSSTSAADTVAAPAPTDLTAEAQRWADSVCARLPLRRRVAQLFMPAIYASGDIWTLRRLREYADSGLCGVILLKGDIAGARMLADTMCCRSAVAPFISIDAEWGLAMRLVDAPEFPANNAIDPDVDDRVMYEYGRELARECRHLGINMVLGPVVDVSSSPNSFMRRRSFGADPHRVADMGVAYARGLEAGGVLGVAKHFPGHGSVSVDSHKQTGIISRSLHEMDSVDLYPFRQWIDNGLSAVMVGHLAVPSIDSEMLPAAVSPVVINDLLRDDLGFRGLVLTDALNMKGVRGYDAADAIMAGADIVLAPLHTQDEIDHVVRAVKEGRLPLAALNDHVARVLMYKYLYRRISPDVSESLDTVRVKSISRQLTGVRDD